MLQETTQSALSTLSMPARTSIAFSSNNITMSSMSDMAQLRALTSPKEGG